MATHISSFPSNPGFFNGEIDKALAARWNEEKVEPSPLGSDSEFLRRASLNLVGRIPTVSEVRLFLDDESPEKRRREVERLLASPAYATHMAGVWENLLLPELNSNDQARFIAGDLRIWVRRKFADNAPYDQIARELVTATPESRPGRYFQVKERKPAEIASGISRMFLGVRLDAQCHNHPFAKWKQAQFWEQAAFFAALEVGPNGQPISSASAEIKIAETDNIVKARYLDGETLAQTEGAQPRQAFAEWLTSKENPYFARAAVNRLWAHLFGVGLVDPVDDFDEANAPSHPELLELLADRFVKSGYDAKLIVRAICATRAYQSSSVLTHPGQADRRLFARAVVKGLTPTQLIDSLSQSIGLRDTANVMRQGFVDPSTPTGMITQVFRNDSSETIDQEASILQALALMNGSLVHQATSPQQGNTLTALIDAPFMTTSDKIEALFLATLSRPPQKDELQRFIKFVESGGTQSASRPTLGGKGNIFAQLLSGDKARTRNDVDVALGDVLWVLLNSSEFLSNH